MTADAAGTGAGARRAAGPAGPSPAAADARGRRPERRDLGAAAAALLAGAVLLVAVVARRNTDGFVVLRTVDHPRIAGAVASVLVLAAGLVLRRPTTLRVVAAVAGVAGFVALPALGSATPPVGATPVKELVAPGGAATARVLTGSGPGRRVWSVRVRVGSGLRAREPEVACFDGTLASDGLGSVSWIGPASLLLTSVAGRRWTVPVDPATGRSRATTPAGTCVTAVA